MKHVLYFRHLCVDLIYLRFSSEKHLTSPIGCIIINIYKIIFWCSRGFYFLSLKLYRRRIPKPHRITEIIKFLNYFTARFQASLCCITHKLILSERHLINVFHFMNFLHVFNFNVATVQIFCKCNFLLFLARFSKIAYILENFAFFIFLYTQTADKTIFFVFSIYLKFQLAILSFFHSVSRKRRKHSNSYCLLHLMPH